MSHSRPMALVTAAVVTGHSIASRLYARRAPVTGHSTRGGWPLAREWLLARRLAAPTRFFLTLAPAGPTFGNEAMRSADLTRCAHAVSPRPEGCRQDARPN
jgi:hypothetical protein